jgi:hypothetical protein
MEFNGCGKSSCFDNIPHDKECWEINGSIGGDKSCALFADMKLETCEKCFFYTLKMKATESVTLLREAYEAMKKEAQNG